MNFSLVWKMLGAPRRALRLKFFGNNQPVILNLLHRWYHFKARRSWAKIKAFPGPADALKWADELRRNGYVQFKPSISHEFLESLYDQADRAFADTASYISPMDGTYRLKNTMEKMPDIAGLFTSDIVRTVEHYYGSFFKIYWAHVYRTLPTNKDPDKSFLWHVDNCPSQVVKLMVYLTDTKENTGSFRLKPRPLSRQLLAQGFWDRARNDHFTCILNDVSTTRVFEGPKGTSILFLNWGCIHRAKHPEIGHRDVAVFFLVPSLIPWGQHLQKSMGELSLREDVCPDPALF